MSTVEKSPYVRFRLLTNNPTFYFTGYENEEKTIVYAYEGQDAEGRKLKKRFKFVDSIMQIHKNKKDHIKHVLESPFCKGSDLGKRQTPYFQMIDPDGDAKKDLEAREVKANAMMRALEVCNDSKRYPMVAVLCGATTGGDMVQKSAIMKFAENQPAKFLELTDKKNTAHMEYESFIKDCVARGTLQNTGGQYLFHQERLGANIGEVIKKFTENPDWLTAIRSYHQEIISGPAAPPKQAIAGGEKKLN